MIVNATSLISQALSLLGVRGIGEPIPGEEAQSCLDVLNNMLDSWNLERLMIYTVQEHVTTLTGNTVTIGPGMQVDVPRPVVLDDWCFTRFNNVDYTINMINGEQYSSITIKSTTSTFPYVAYYDAQNPTGTIYFWPIPPQPLELHLRLRQQLTEFATPETEIDLPQGYRRAITYSLAEELGPQYRGVDPMISKIAAKARMNIKRMNNPENVLNMPTAIYGKRRMGFNIYTGQ